MHEHDTAELVRRSRAGDTRAFEVLFRRYQDTIYRLALYLLTDPSVAEDVTQEVFVRAWEHLERLRDDKAFGGWLRMIALNLCRDAQRRQPPLSQAEAVDPDFKPTDDRGVEDQATGNVIDAAVRRAVASLPAHQRLVVAMHHLEDMDVETIAQVLNLPRGTVLSRLARGRQMLRNKLAGSGLVP